MRSFLQRSNARRVDRARRLSSTTESEQRCRNRSGRIIGGLALSLMMTLFSFSGFSQNCDIEITVSSSGWGDETTWTLTDNVGTVVLSGGTYGNGYSDTQTLTAAGDNPYTFFIESTLGDNSPDYSVSVDGVVIASGTVAGPGSFSEPGIAAGCVPPTPDPCDISVTVSSSGWGDGTTWSLTNAFGIAVLSGGTYGNGYSDTQIINAADEGPYTFTVASTMGDNSPNYSVSVGGTVVVSGNVPGTESFTESDIASSCSAPTCDSVPTPGNTNSTDASVCDGESFTLSVDNPGLALGISFQWQSSPDGASWSNDGPTTPTWTTTQSDDTFYRCEVTCDGEGSATSTALEVLMSPVTSCYCDAGPTSTADSDLFEVELIGSGANISNNVGCSAELGVADFTSQSADLVTGQTYTLDVVMGQCGGGTFTNTLKAWIDYNQDGVFDEATEELGVVTGATSSTGVAYSITFTVPSGALEGATTMRVVQRETGTASLVTPCGTFTWGSAHDYSINMILADVCDETPVPGATLSSETDVCNGESFTLTLENAFTSSGITYQWQTSPDGASWTNAGPDLPVWTTDQSEGTFYRCIVTCDGEGSGTSTPVEIPMSAASSCICTDGVGPTSTFDSELLSVTLNGSGASINNPTPCPATTGVQDFTSLSADLATEQTYTLEVLMGQCGGGTFTNNLKAWIDWNQDGIFDEATEEIGLVGGATSSAGVPYSITFTVPATAELGNTIMRVMQRETTNSALVTPCAGFSWGSVHDYGINVFEATACDEIPVPGATLSSESSVCGDDSFTLSLENTFNTSGITYQWQSSPDGVSWSNDGPTTPTWSTTQSAATFYRCEVTCDGEGTGVSTPIEVSQQPGSACLCEPTYTNGKTDGDLISNVEIPGTTLANNTGTDPVNPAYTYFPPNPPANTTTAELSAGTSYDIEVTYGSFTGQHCAVWIDFNGDGVFDISERVGFTTNASSSPFETVSFTISLPCDPDPGTYRMRVRNVWNTTGANIDPCDNYGWGETEDYDVTVLPPPPCPQPSAFALDAVGLDFADLSWNTGCAETQWEVEYGAPGFTLGSGTNVPASATVFTLTGLTSATAYEVYLRADCDVDGVSNWVGPLNFNTSDGGCENGINFPGAGVNAPNDNEPVVITTCQFQTEYNTLNGATAGATYISDMTDGGASTGFITVRQGSPGGLLVDSGNAPLTWTAPTSDVYFVHYTVDDLCNTAGNCVTTTITCSSCPAPGVGGCTDENACNFDPGASIDDGSCVFICNDLPSGALLVNTTGLNAACETTTQAIEDATSNAGGGATAFGNDLWYQFEAVTAGCRIEATAAAIDLVLELQDMDGNTLETEDSNFTSSGAEILNYGQLEPGEMYRIRVANWSLFSGSGDIDLCVKWLPATECDYGSGPYSLCNVFKAKWIGPADYSFVYTNVETGVVDGTFTTNGLTTHLLRQAEGLQWDTEYEVTVNATLTLTNGVGQEEFITVENNNGCTIFIEEAPLTKVRDGFGGMSESEPVNYGPFGIVRADFACESTSYTWSFNDGSFLGDGIEYTKFSAGNVLGLGPVGLDAGTYAVRVKATFADGTETEYGATRYISITPATGMATEVESPVVMMDNDKVFDDEIFDAAIAIYPNPNRGDNFNLNISGIEAGTDRVMLDVYDLYGKLVISEQLAVGGESLNIVVPLDGIADGMYLVNVIMDGKVYTERMIVQK